MFKVFDNGGRTVDRYTIYMFARGKGGRLVPDGCITTDGRPLEADGFWQHGFFIEGVVGVAEQQIDVLDLPRTCILKLIKELEMDLEYDD